MKNLIVLINNYLNEMKIIIFLIKYFLNVMKKILIKPMKKLFILLLCLPIFSFYQENGKLTKYVAASYYIDIKLVSSANIADYFAI